MARKEDIGFYAGDIPSKGKIAWELKVEQEKVGSQWKIKSIEKRTVTKEYYINSVSNDTMRFFRRLGGSERRVMTYTPYGYIPVEVSSVSPDRSTRVIRRYYFKDMGKSFMYALNKWNTQFDKEKSTKKRRAKVPAPFGL